MIAGSTTSDAGEALALGVLRNRRNRGSGATVFEVKPAAELPGTTSRFFAVSSNFDLHVGNALAEGNADFVTNAGAKQRTGRNVTMFGELAAEADADSVGTVTTPTIARLNAIDEISRCFMSPR